MLLPALVRKRRRSNASKQDFAEHDRNRRRRRGFAVAACGGGTLPRVKPGEALDITITGFLRAEAGGGQQDDLQRNPDKARGLDFRNNSEVHVLARGKSEESGLEYGATVEFEADTNQTLNTDETWIFLRGGWGELRMGDEDGAVDNSIIGGQTIAAGTGGIDGSSFVVAGIAGEGVFPTETDDPTKIRYYTPSFGGFSLGISFTPTVELSTAGPTTATSSRTRAAPWRWRPRTSPKAPRSMTATLAASASRHPLSASTAG